MNKYFKFLSVLVSILPQLLWADVKLNTLFSDHMVIQRETEIPVWGWADPNEEVSVVTSWGITGQVITGADGTWKVKIKTPKAGGPFTITISGKNKIIINDVLSGDVWLCSGQSNMDFEMSKFLRDAREPQYQPLVEYVRKEVKTVNDNWIRHIEVPQKTSLYEKQNNFKGQWVSANPEQIGVITATGYFFAKELRKHVNVPIGLLECSWGGTRIQPWISKETYIEDENMRAYLEASRKKSKSIIEKMEAEGYVDTAYETKLKKWKENNQKGRKPSPSKSPRNDHQLPTTLHNGMISSIVPFAIKGVIWYQGESNSQHLQNEYSKYLSKLITSWRKEWNQGDFPFYWAQLAACNRGNKASSIGWAVVNDQMRRTMNLPNTGMAVLYDIGEAKDIHPHNKMDAGKRLALWALAKDYKIKVPSFSGPLYKSMKIMKSKIQVTFNEVGNGLIVGYKKLLNDVVVVNESLKTFEIQDESGDWVSAEAKIISKNKIEVWNSKIPNPINVRYAWASNPEGANLYNKQGLPASVFTTKNNN